MSPLPFPTRNFCGCWLTLCSPLLSVFLPVYCREKAEAEEYSHNLQLLHEMQHEIVLKLTNSRNRGGRRGNSGGSAAAGTAAGAGAEKAFVTPYGSIGVPSGGVRVMGGMMAVGGMVMPQLPVPPRMQPQGIVQPRMQPQGVVQPRMQPQGIVQPRMQPTLSPSQPQPGMSIFSQYQQMQQAVTGGGCWALTRWQ